MKREKIVERMKNVDYVKRLPEIQLPAGDLPPEEKYHPIIEVLKNDSGAMVYLVNRLKHLGILIFDKDRNTVKGCDV